MSMKPGVTCHAPGERCLGCPHYYGRAERCAHAPTIPWTRAEEVANGTTVHAALQAFAADAIVELFLPAPRPVPRDPFFQHTTPLSRDAWVWFAPFHAHYEMRGDWQWPNALVMDAPNTMPAGACQGFDYSDGVYGAQQMTCPREAL